jgi:hypothetical protein
MNCQMFSVGLSSGHFGGDLNKPEILPAMACFSSRPSKIIDKEKGSLISNQRGSTNFVSGLLSEQQTKSDSGVSDNGKEGKGFEHEFFGFAMLAQKPWIVPIPGTTKLRRLEENVGAAAVAPTPDDLSEIDGAVSKITVQGDRYPAHLQARVGR